MTRISVLVVCTGNICRSPMAEAIARKVIADSLHLPEAQLAKEGYKVTSAGATAFSGAPAADNAREAVKSLGGDLSNHRSRPLTAQMLNQASIILAMGKSHLEMVKMISPSAADKAVLLDPAGDIDDPIGGDLALYKNLAAKIKQAIEKRLADNSLLGSEK